MVNEEGKHSTAVINDALDKYSRIDSRDRAMFVRLVHGTLEYQFQLDYIIGQYSSVKIKKMKPLIRNILRMTAYEIIYLDKVPDSAAIDESVKLVKKTALRNLAGFVNAVARKISAEKEQLIEKLSLESNCAIVDTVTSVGHNDCVDSCVTADCRDSLTYDAVRYSVPEWMLNLIIETVGEEDAKTFLEDSLQSHGLSVRYVGTDEIKLLDSVNKLTELDEWKQGKIIAQDYSSTQPVIRAGIEKGNIVIDVCSAPGGKAIQASEHVGDTGKVIACDLTEKKTTKIKENVSRLHIKNMEILVQDATVYNGEFEKLADVVLADLPCSGIGTISGKPDIKNRLTLEDCKELASLQLKILNNVCNYVKPGGKLVYSTCTIDHYENDDNVEAFAREHSNFELLSKETIIKEGADGFFVAVFRRNG